MSYRHRVSVTADRRGLGGRNTSELIRRAVRLALKSEGVALPCRINVLLTGDGCIQALNLEYRGLDRPTDVLSFPMQELEPGAPIDPGAMERDPDTGEYILGDMAISVERAREQAVRYGHSAEREIAFLAVHSTLHLLGYDHEKSEEGRRAMRDKEEQILKELELAR